jgi:hypothetical protein
LLANTFIARLLVEDVNRNEGYTAYPGEKKAYEMAIKLDDTKKEVSPLYSVIHSKHQEVTLTQLKGVPVSLCLVDYLLANV